MGGLQSTAKPYKGIPDGAGGARLFIRLRMRYHYRPLRKNSAAAHEKERIIYTMSEFNIYARKLDTAFKEARSEYNTAFRALQEAQQASRDANAWTPGDSAEKNRQE